MSDDDTTAAPTAGSAWRQGLWSVVAAFGAYFCMYAFRKPFTAATYSGQTFFGLDLKTVLVISQVLGYATSKFIGIRVIAELPPRMRSVGILTLIGAAELALLLFAVTPAPYSVIFLFFNGLPLGMVFGLVLGFLEGRRQTEALAAGLCASFILADGFTKSVGVSLLDHGVSERWMPVTAGVLFLLPLAIFVAMLTRIPPPDQRDVAARSARTPINREQRRRFFARYAGGLSLLVLAYLMVTILRALRADFAPELWKGLGAEAPPAMYTQSEIWVALAVIVINGLCVFIADNRRAFFTALGISALGLAVLAATLLWQQAAGLPPFLFMVLLGVGLYLPYVAVHTTVFERLIAMTRDRSNLGYLMYLADAFGYLGYVAVLLLKNLFKVDGDFLKLFLPSAVVITGIGLLSLLGCWVYFARRPAVAPESAPVAVSISDAST